MNLLPLQVQICSQRMSGFALAHAAVDVKASKPHYGFDPTALVSISVV